MDFHHTSVLQQCGWICSLATYEAPLSSPWSWGQNLEGTLVLQQHRKRTMPSCCQHDALTGNQLTIPSGLVNIPMYFATLHVYVKSLLSLAGVGGFQTVDSIQVI